MTDTNNSMDVLWNRDAKHIGGHSRQWSTFIMPAGLRAISSQQGPWCFWEAQFYTPHYVIGYVSATSKSYMIEFYNK